MAYSWIYIFWELIIWRKSQIKIKIHFYLIFELKKQKDLNFEPWLIQSFIAPYSRIQIAIEWFIWKANYCFCFSSQKINFKLLKFKFLLLENFFDLSYLRPILMKNLKFKKKSSLLGSKKKYVANISGYWTRSTNQTGAKFDLKLNLPFFYVARELKRFSKQSKKLFKNLEKSLKKWNFISVMSQVL